MPVKVATGEKLSSLRRGPFGLGCPEGHPKQLTSTQWPRGATASVVAEAKTWEDLAKPW